jgi:hypothetical protein
MTEWWQEGEEDVPAPIPRRDSIPETHFTEPDDVSSAPELATFIPEWRAKRRVIAIVTTVVALGGIIWSAIDIRRIMSIACPSARADETGRFVVAFIVLSVSLVAIVQVWWWANQKDPRDRKGPSV